MTTTDARLIAAQEALKVGVWTVEERDGMSAEFEAAQRKHGYYESLFAVAAFILRHRAKALTAPVEAAPLAVIEPQITPPPYDCGNTEMAHPVGAMGEEAAKLIKRGRSLYAHLGETRTCDLLDRATVGDLTDAVESLEAENARLTGNIGYWKRRAEANETGRLTAIARIRELEAAQGAQDEVTGEMLLAAKGWREQDPREGLTGELNMFERIYRAMRSAAPSPAPQAPMSEGPKMVRNARGDLVPDIPPICGCRKECLRPHDCAHDKETPAPQARKEDGWIEWKGGRIPVSGKMVYVRFATGEQTPDAIEADEFCWRHKGDSGDIIAYKPATPEENSRG